MCKKNRIRSIHPFLYTNGKEVFSRKTSPAIGLEPVRTTFHHLYPKKRVDISKDNECNKKKFLLRIWEHKHFYGWNKLFQFFIKEENKCYELTIDEIITLMVVRHRIIEEKVGTRPWKILFGNKSVDEALDILCRMLAMKFNYQWQHSFPVKIKFVTIIKQAA